MNTTTRFALAMLTVAAVSGGCAKTELGPATPAASSSTTQTSSAPSPTTTSEAPTPDPVLETATPTPTPEFLGAKFGETGSFTYDDSATFTVTVSAPAKAKCQYASIGCDKPTTGDRVVTAKVVVKNTSSEPIEIGANQFVLEFADGTRMESFDGSASDYRPDNSMEYTQKMRPGSTYTSTLTFEAPAGAFSIIMLSGNYGGEDLFAWK